MDIRKFKTATKLLIIIGMVCFFFPFAMVSCSGKSVEATGFELMTTISMHEDIQFDDEDAPNPYLAIAFTCGLVGLGCAWKTQERDKKILVAGCCAIGGSLCLLLFCSTFWRFYGLTGYEGRVTLSAPGVEFHSQQS